MPNAGYLYPMVQELPRHTGQERSLGHGHETARQQRDSRSPRNSVFHLTSVKRHLRPQQRTSSRSDRTNPIATGLSRQCVATDRATVLNPSRVPHRARAGLERAASAIMDVSVAIAPQPTTQQLAAVDKSKPGKVTGKLKVAVDAMVWEGLDYQKAATKAELTTRAVRLALERPHVKAYYNSQLDVLLTAESARNIHRLVTIRDKADNMPAVQAIDRLQKRDETAATRTGLAQFPGFVIHVSNAPVQQHVADGVSAKHQAISTTYEEVVEPTPKPPHE